MAKKLDPQEIERFRRKRPVPIIVKNVRSAYMTESAKIGKAAV